MITRAIQKSLILAAGLLTNAGQGNADEFYQWHLENDGSFFQKDFDDIHSSPVRAKLGFDSNAVPARSRALSKTPVVAVLDTGLDLDHPEFAGRILKNEAECENGNLPSDGSRDKDGNGYKADCLGYNVIGDNHRPYDNSKGHGTHIAGIIAASADGTGVEGLDDRIKILPVKVLDRGQAKAETFAKGIEYAVSRKVDVINLSLGWPEIFNTSRVARALEKAAAAGVYIVAAAGNNSHDRPIYPCAYDEVICVGSIDPDGAVSSFSNYGPTVDLMAPGFTIASTIPRKNRSQFLQVKGYDYRSGTSQAAPQVAAALALLKASYPSESRADHLARLLGTTKSLGQSNLSLFGLVQIDSALSSRPANLIRPQLASSQFVEVDGSGRFSLTVPFQNLSRGAARVTVKIENLPAGLSLDRSSQTSASVASGADSSVRFTGRANLQSLSARSQTQLVMSSGGQSWRFPLPLFFSQTWREDSSDRLATSASYSTCQGEEACYYQLSGRSLSIAFYNDSGRYQQVKTNLASGARVLSVARLSQGFAVQTRESIAGSTQLAIRLLDFSGNSLIAGSGVWSWRPEYASPAGPLQWLERAGELPLPVFLTSAGLPDLDRDDFAGGSDPRPANHLYILAPDSQNALVTRVIDSAYWREELANKLRLEFNDFIDVVSYFKHRSGESFLTLSTGRGATRSVYLVKISLNPEQIDSPDTRGQLANVSSHAKISLPSGVLLDNNRVFDVSGAIGEAQAFTSLDDARRARTLVLDYSRPQSPKVAARKNLSIPLRSSDILIGGLAMFRSGGEFQAVYETKSSLIVQSLNRNWQNNLNIYRYSFLPGSLFSQQFLAGEEGIYVDNTTMRSGSVGFISVDQSGSRLSVARQQTLPSNCVALSPKLVNSRLNFFAQCGSNLVRKSL